MKRIFFSLIVLGIIFGLVETALRKNSSESAPLAQLKERYGKKAKPSIDHSLFPQLRKTFTKPSEMTYASSTIFFAAMCLSRGNRG